MTPNEVLLSIQIGRRFYFTVEWIPREVGPLYDLVEWQRGEGYLTFGIGRVVVMVNKEQA
jgi:hypothetical protein